MRHALADREIRTDTLGTVVYMELFGWFSIQNKKVDFECEVSDTEFSTSTIGEPISGGNESRAGFRFNGRFGNTDTLTTNVFGSYEIQDERSVPVEFLSPGICDEVYATLMSATDDRIAGTITGTVGDYFNIIGKLTLAEVPLGAQKTWSVDKHRYFTRLRLAPLFVINWQGRVAISSTGVESLGESDVFARECW